MQAIGYTLFDTAVGRCGMAWSERGIVSVKLPEADEARTIARLKRSGTKAEETPPPADVQRAIAAIQSLLEGARTDLSSIAVDLDGVPEFNRQVYEIARAIPVGGTLTYGDIAKKLGDLQLSRAVGQAMGQNPVPIVVPCHRVLRSDGGISGYRWGVERKRKLIALERELAGADQAN